MHGVYRGEQIRSKEGREEKSGKLCRGVSVLEEEQKLTKRLRPRRAFQTWRTVLPNHRGLLPTAFLLEVVRYDREHRSLKDTRLSILYLRQIRSGHHGLTKHVLTKVNSLGSSETNA